MCSRKQTGCRQIQITVSNRWFMMNVHNKTACVHNTNTRATNNSVSTNQMGPWQPLLMLCTTEAGATSLQRKWWASTVSLKYPSTRAAKDKASALQAICNSWKWKIWGERREESGDKSSYKATILQKALKEWCKAFPYTCVVNNPGMREICIFITIECKGNYFRENMAVNQINEIISDYFTVVTL